jgi:C-terminal processing protease CtpA/Prc
MKEAQDGALLLANMIHKQKEHDLEAQVGLKQDTEEKQGKTAVEAPSPSARETTKAVELRERLGVSLKRDINSDIAIDEILPKSPADEAGVKKGDLIVSVWGKLARYMTLNDVYDMILRNTPTELRIMASRHVVLTLKKRRMFNGAESMIGGKLRMKFEGLTVEKTSRGEPLEEAGVLEGDLVTRIENFSTRYMPLETVYKVVEETKGDSLDLAIQRELIVWKR